MTIRITDLHQNQARARWISDNRSRSALLERNIATGKAIHQASEDPAASTRLMRHDLRLQRVDQYDRNIGNAKLWLGSADHALQSASTNLSRAKSLAVQAGNSFTDADTRAAISADIRAIRSEMLVIANSQAAGRMIFAGTANVVEAYDAAGAYQGDMGLVLRDVDVGETVDVSAPGPTVFGVANPGDPLNGTAFEMLDQLAADIDANNTAGVRDGIEAVDAAALRISSVVGRIGARTQQLDAAEIRQGGERENVEARASALRDTDVVEAIVQLRAAQASYEASLSATTRAISRSLLDFLN
ncbi:MAG: flagellar hook-associated protein FlgL [Actinomycetota bacterium]